MASGTAGRGFHVPVGQDRNQENALLIWGLIPLAIKLSTEDSGGALFMFEHRHMSRGGPPRHVHHQQDEWFYVVEGEFAMEIEDQKFRLKAGDSAFAPRKIPHVWANVGEQPGTLLTMVSPAGTFETFIRDTARLPSLPSPSEIEQAFAAHGMTVVGPPLQF